MPRFKVGDPVIYHGEKTLVVYVYDETECHLRDEEYPVLMDDLSPVDGVDYTKTKVPIYEEGDLVVCKLAHFTSYYGALSANRTMTTYKNKIGVITNILSGFYLKEEGSRYRCSFDDGEWAWNSLMLEKFESPTFKKGDICIQITEGRLCVFDGRKFENANGEAPQAFVPVTEKELKLESDVFGIGKKGDRITGYFSNYSDNVFAKANNKIVTNILYENEYTEV